MIITNEFYKKQIFLFTLLFVLISNFSFAEGLSHQDKELLSTCCGFFGVIALVGSMFLYFCIILPMIKKKKLEDYCKKNGLTFIKESNKLPDNLEYKFIKLDAGNNGRTKYENIVYGKKDGITFAFCDFNFRYSGKGGTLNSPNFPLLIIKKDNINLPNFLLISEMHLGGYTQTNSYSGSKNGNFNLREEYTNHIQYFEGKELKFKEDYEFSKKFTLKVEDEEKAKNFFNIKIRKIFKDYYKDYQIFEGNGDCFIVSSSLYFNFEDMIGLLEESLSLLNKLTTL